MKPTRHNKVLGIAVGEKSMQVAELHAASGQPQVVKTAEFSYPEGRSLKDPEALGSAFADFLRDQKFGASSAQFGLPARWVLSKYKEVPAVGASLLNDTLRLQAPMEFSSELGELVFDYTGVAPGIADGTTGVLLAGVPKKYVDQIAKFADAARLKPLAVTPFATALGGSIAAAADAMILLLGPSGVEFISQKAGHPRTLRYVGTSADSTRNLVGELRRAAPTSGAGAGQQEIFVFNDAGIDEAPLKTLEQTLGIRLRDGQPKDLGVQGAASAAAGHDFAAAISLGVAAAMGRGAIDFLDSRLAPPPVKRVSRQMILGIAAGAAAVLALGFWFFTLHSKDAELLSNLAEYNSHKSTRDAAQAEVTKIEYAGRWKTGKPRYVACLKDLTEQAPNSPDLYGTVFTLSEDPKGNLTGHLDGKASQEPAIFAFEEQLKKSKHFTNLSDHRTRSDNNGKTEISYSISFLYVP